MISAAEPVRRVDLKLLWILALAVLAVFVALLFASGRVDFHPDEAIYFDGIPVQLRSDAGLVYELAYYPAWAMHSIRIARTISCLFAAATFLACVALLKGAGPLRPLHVAGLCACFVLSYPVIFHGARVRPEISWLFTACACAAMLARFRRSGALRYASMAALFLFLTGLNHKLAWFAILYISVYCSLEFWIRPQARLGLVLVLCGAVSGPIVNQIARAIWLHSDIASSLAALASKPDARHQSLPEFLTFIFKDAGLFLADQAANRGWIQAAFGTDDAHFSDYYLLNASLAAAPFVIALARTPWQAFCFGFPAFFLCACFATGYYNPTYAPFLVQMLAVACASVLVAPANATRLDQGRRWIASAFLFYLLVPSASFIVTRIVREGPTGTFKQFSAVQKALEDLHASGAQNFVVSERFQNAVPRSVKAEEAFKADPDLSATDVLVYDDYDERMYAFVPDFEGRKARMRDFIRTQCVVSSTPYLVYPNGATYPDPDRPGSWFFRHSIGGTLTIAKRCHG